MDELTKNYSPSFRELIGIVEVLRDTINNIDEVYEKATREVIETWKKKL